MDRVFAHAMISPSTIAECKLLLNRDFVLSREVVLQSLRACEADSQSRDGAPKLAQND